MPRSWAIALATVLTLAHACSGKKTVEYQYVVVDGGSQPSDGVAGTDASAASVDDDASAAGGAAASGGDGAMDASGVGGVMDATGDSGEPTATFQDAGTYGNLLYVKASNPDAEDWFGRAVAVSGNWLAVGAPNESSRASGIDGDQADDSEDGSGAVYLYSGEAGAWAQRAYVKASNPEAVDGFGDALALDGATLVVGAPFEDGAEAGINVTQGNGAANAGAVYAFTRTGDTWQQDAYIKPSNTDALDWFGTSVALSSDLLVVGAPGEDSGATGVDGDESDDSVAESGAVYVLSRATGAWAHASYLKALNPSEQDRFGAAVAVSGATLVVGAPRESSSGFGSDADPADEGAVDSGAVYVFERGAAGWEQTAYLKASNTGAGDGFGGHLALDGDVLAVAATGEDGSSPNSDGVTTNDSATDSGAVYVFERSGGEWVQQAYLKSEYPDTDEYFGFGVAVRGDAVVVGVLGDAGTLTSPASARMPYSGAAYVFRRSIDGWSRESRMKAPNAEANDRYGRSVALSDEFLAVGAMAEASASPGINGDQSDNSTPGAGAIFLYAR